MSIIRITKQKNFSIISNLPLNDPNLSMKARGIWATLLSKPDDGTVYVTQLVKTCKDGKASIYSGLKELKEAGYIEHVFIRDEGGKMVRGEYIVHEDPIAVETPVNPEHKPDTENRDTDNRDTDNPPLLKTDTTKDGLKKNTDDVPPPEPDPAPQGNEPEPSSSSFSKSDLIKTVAALMTLVPEKFQKTSVENTIGDAMGTHTVDYVRTAILYTTAMSNGGTIQKFRSYLGQCLEKHWHKNWTPEEQPDQTAIREEFSKMGRDVLKMLAGAGNQLALDELKHRGE